MSCGLTSWFPIQQTRHMLHDAFQVKWPILTLLISWLLFSLFRLSVPYQVPSTWCSHVIISEYRIPTNILCVGTRNIMKREYPVFRYSAPYESHILYFFTQYLMITEYAAFRYSVRYESRISATSVLSTLQKANYPLIRYSVHYESRIIRYVGTQYLIKAEYWVCWY